MNINYYNPYIRKELELYHHGIAGQKWGKRNGPPYPLAASAHSASEKKAGWRKSLSGSDGIRYGSDRRTEQKEVKALKKRLKQNEKDYIKNQAAYDNHGRKAMIAMQRGNAKALQEEANKQFFAKSKIQKAESDTWKAIAELIDKGYDVSTEAYMEYASKGEKIAQRLLTVGGLAATGAGIGTLNYPLGMIGMTTLGFGASVSNTANKIQVNKYHVEKNPEGGKGRLYLQNRVGEKEEMTFETYDKEDKSSKSTENKTKKSSSNKQFPTTKSATNKFLNLSYEKRQQAMDNVRHMSNQDFTMARQMLNSGRSYEEIAKRLGVSESTVWAIFTDNGS